MKIPYSILVFFTSCFGYGEVNKRPSESGFLANGSFYDLKANSIDGTLIKFSDYKGKNVLIVNTASKCGFTPQFKDLQKFHETHGDSVVILGFPSNEFGGQDPGTEKEIKAFCQKNYGVTFQMFEKVKVKGNDKHPIYDWLTDLKKNGWNEQEPKWNFTKYTINNKGELAGVYGSSVSPFDKRILKDFSK